MADDGQGSRCATYFCGSGECRRLGAPLGVRMVRHVVKNQQRKRSKCGTHEPAVPARDGIGRHSDTVWQQTSSADDKAAHVVNVAMESRNKVAAREKSRVASANSA